MRRRVERRKRLVVAHMVGLRLAFRRGTPSASMREQPAEHLHRRPVCRAGCRWASVAEARPSPDMARRTSPTLGGESVCFHGRGAHPQQLLWRQRAAGGSNGVADASPRSAASQAAAASQDHARTAAKCLRREVPVARIVSGPRIFAPHARARPLPRSCMQSTRSLALTLSFSHGFVGCSGIAMLMSMVAALAALHARFAAYVARVQGLCVCKGWVG